MKELMDLLKIKSFPEKTGVYLFKNKLGNVIYVGKAINLKKRLINYFEKRLVDQKITMLLREAKKIDYEIAGSELEALLLEARLIKQYRPKYNVRLKDGTRYLYVGISAEKFPRVYLLRQPEKERNLLAWYGPFPTASSLREILRTFRRIFPFRTCRKLPPKPCLYYQLKLCPGVCSKDEFSKEYQATIRKIRLFLSGNIGSLRKKLEQEMMQLAKDLRFEEAKKRKEQLLAIQNLLGKFKRMPEEEEILKQLHWLRQLLIRYQGIDPLLIRRLEAYDVANLGEEIIVGSMIVFVNGEPDKQQYRQFKIRAKQGDPQALAEILDRRLSHQDWVYPQLILVDGGKSQLSALFKVLKKLDLVGEIALMGLTKEKETIVIPVIDRRRIKSWKLVIKSSKTLGLPVLQFARDEAHRFAQRYYKKLHRSSLLGQDKN